MGRGKVEMKRIDNNINRQVTFSKRRSGLFKKAHEISVLCDANLALIVFSTKGKVFEYSSPYSSMDTILDRYETYSYAQARLLSNNTSTDALPHRGHDIADSQENWSLEFTKLKARIQMLQTSHSHFMGEDIESLSVRDLQNLEQQLDTSLKHIRSRKNQLMHQSICELQKKEKAIQDQNKLLSNKIKENAEWEVQQNNVLFNCNFLSPPQPQPLAMEEETNQLLDLTLQRHQQHLRCFAS